MFQRTGQVNNYGMKPPTEHSLKHMPVVGYIVMHRKDKTNPDYYIACNLNRQAFHISISGRDSGNIWGKTNFSTLPTKNEIKHSLEDKYYLFNTFEEMIEKFPFFYDQYVLLQPPSDLTPGKYYDRRLTMLEYYKRIGWTMEEYREAYPRDGRDNVPYAGSNVIIMNEVNK